MFESNEYILLGFLSQIVPEIDFHCEVKHNHKATREFLDKKDKNNLEAHRDS